MRIEKTYKEAFGLFVPRPLLLLLLLSSIRSYTQAVSVPQERCNLSWRNLLAQVGASRDPMSSARSNQPRLWNYFALNIITQCFILGHHF